MTATAKQLAAFQARLDKNEKEAIARHAKMAVARLRAKMALKGKKPTSAEEHKAVLDDRRRRQLEADREKARADYDARGVPAHRRLC